MCTQTPYNIWKILNWIDKWFYCVHLTLTPHQFNGSGGVFLLLITVYFILLVVVVGCIYYLQLLYKCDWANKKCMTSL